MKQTIFILTFFFLALYAGSSQTVADTIYFKDGSKVETEQTWEEGDQVKCRRFGGEVTYSKKDVERIERGITEAQENLNAMLTDEEKYYGNPPENYEQTIRSHLNEVLFDPYSIKELSFNEPLKKVLDKPLFAGLKTGQIIWGVSVSYNAKNRYGAYTGKKTHIYFFRGNDIIHTLD